jgi:hypothetical protein
MSSTAEPTSGQRRRRAAWNGSLPERQVAHGHPEKSPAEANRDRDSAKGLTLGEKERAATQDQESDRDRSQRAL